MIWQLSSSTLDHLKHGACRTLAKTLSKRRPVPTGSTFLRTRPSSLTLRDTARPLSTDLRLSLHSPRTPTLVARKRKTRERRVFSTSSSSASQTRATRIPYKTLHLFARYLTKATKTPQTSLKTSTREESQRRTSLPRSWGNLRRLPKASSLQLQQPAVIAGRPRHRKILKIFF